MAAPTEHTIPSSIKSLKPIRESHGLPVYEDNPFLEAFGVKIKKKSSMIATGLQVKDEEDKDVSCGMVAMYKEVDVEQFIKIYTSEMSSIFDLTSPAVKVLIILIHEVQSQSKDKAEVFMSFSQAEAYCKETGKKISQPTFSRGIRELIENRFIAKSYRGIGWYWINPGVIFNGDRVNFIKSYKIKRKKERLEEIAEEIGSSH